MKNIKYLLLLLIPLIAFSAPRAWTSNDGRTIEAEALSKSEIAVVVRRTTDDQIVTIPLALLSVDDQNYVKQTDIPPTQKEPKKDQAPASQAKPASKSPGGAQTPLEAWNGLKDALKGKH